MRPFLRALICVLASVAPAIATAQARPPAFSSGSIALLQPEAEMSERLSGDVDALAAYIQKLTAACAAAGEARPQGTGTTGVLVVALRPGGRSRVWLEYGPNDKPEDMASELSDHLESIPPPLVWGGTVSFLINIDFWGGGEPLTTSERPFFAPAEWQEAVKRAGHPLDTESILDRVWPDR